MAGYIHDDIKELMEDSMISEAIAHTHDFTKDQLKRLDVLLQFIWNRGYKSFFEEKYIHDNIKEVMEEAALSEATYHTHDFTIDQLKRLEVLMQYAWNRGYKSACQDMAED